MRAGLLAALLLVSCAYRKDKLPDGSPLGIAYDKSQLSFSLVSQVVFAPKCVACHGSSGGVSLDSYASVKQNIARIENAVFVARSMPRAPSTLTPAESQLLSDWIAAGAPEHGSAPPPPPPLEPKFASIHDRIFARSCLGCHNPTGGAKDVPLATAADLTGSADQLVIPGDPDGSYLVILISPGARKPMPPPDSGMNALSAEEISVIRTWVKNGAKD